MDLDLIRTIYNFILHIKISSIFWTWVKNNQRQTSMWLRGKKSEKQKKQTNTDQRDSPKKSHTSLNYMAACWRLRSSFRLHMTDPGPWIHHVSLFACLPSLPPLSSLSETANRWILPSASPGEARMCVCLSTLMAMLAVMCLIEDKQHSLKEVFTVKHFLQHHHAECTRGNTLPPSPSFKPWTHTHTILSVHPCKDKLLHTQTTQRVWIISLKADFIISHSKRHTHACAHTNWTMSSGDEFQL